LLWKLLIAIIRKYFVTIFNDYFSLDLTVLDYRPPPGAAVVVVVVVLRRLLRKNSGLNTKKHFWSSRLPSISLKTGLSIEFLSLKCIDLSLLSSNRSPKVWQIKLKTSINVISNALMRGEWPAILSCNTC